jgi:hypothetical protein
MPKYEVWKLTVVKFVQDIEADNEEEAVDTAMAGEWEVYSDHDTIEVYEKENN